MRPLALMMLWTLGAASLGFAQDRAEDTRLVQTTPGNCEMNAAALDSVRSEALEEANKAGVVIVIARLGTRETSMQNRRRLQIVKTYLSSYGLESQRIVAAEGERVAGYGRIELYVAGKLRVVLLANRNKPICVECCNPDDADLYRAEKSGKNRGQAFDSSIRCVQALSHNKSSYSPSLKTKNRVRPSILRFVVRARSIS